MLDKTIDFHSIILKCQNNCITEAPTIPKGYKVRYYEDGDENAWAKIQTAVGEFKNRSEAQNCFNLYKDNIAELKQRQLYVIDESNGKAVATTTAWFGEKKNHPIGVVHALSCLPKHQSLGLGRFVAAQMMYCFYELMPGAEIWLDTQTWSYKAVGIYMDLGFIPMKTATFNEVPNEYDKAVCVLKDKMRPDIYQRFINTAE